MPTLDQFYTPPEIADHMVSHATVRARQTIVADFSAGDGGLLRAAAARWPRAHIIATDLRPSAVRRLNKASAGWSVGKTDFLSARSRARCSVLTGAVGQVTLALLNPPFSCRGAKSVAVELNGKAFRCGPALAFVVNAIPYLAPHGQIVVVLPRGSLQSQRDRQVWETIRDGFTFQIIRTNQIRTFEGCFPRTVVVRLQRRQRRRRDSPAAVQEESKASKLKGELVRITRGSIPMFRVNGDRGRGTAPLVHSTNLRCSTIAGLEHRVRDPKRVITGPALLLPRVGQPDSRKVCTYDGSRPITLSDCVYALNVRSGKSLRLLKQKLIAHWPRLREKYAGTCAPYLTNAALEEFLRELGYAPADT